MMMMMVMMMMMMMMMIMMMVMMMWSPSSFVAAPWSGHTDCEPVAVLQKVQVFRLLAQPDRD
jgi:hypothetical protein